jgi:gliding motility-associated-like protein
MKIFLTVILLAFETGLHAQQFLKLQELILPDSLTSVLPQSVDLDNDGLPDLLLLAANEDGEHFMMFVKGDTVNVPVLSTRFVKIPDVSAHHITDYDNDNQMDVILSGAGDEVLLCKNLGGFQFDKITIGLPGFSTIAFADLDNNGRRECIVSGTSAGGDYFTKTFQHNGDLLWTVAHDSLKVLLSDIRIADFNADGLADLFISGKEQASDTTFAGIFLRNGKRFTSAVQKEINAQGCLSDVNLDGLMDVVAFGTDETSIPVFVTFKSDGGTFSIDDAGSLKVISTFSADFNSDGLTDALNFGVNGTDTVHVLEFAGGGVEMIAYKGLREELVADIEHDGDLDLIHVTYNNKFSIQFYENILPSENATPAGPKHSIAIPVYGRTLFYWEDATDDHTPAASLTYDLYINAGGSQYNVDFDLLNEKRLTVSHGNNHTSNFRLLGNISATQLEYAIQSVDNSFHAGPGGVCVGSGTACVAFEDVKVSACENVAISLKAPTPALWFSFSDGYLGTSANLNVEHPETDTIFYFIPNFQGCSVLKAFPVQIEPIKKESVEQVYACEGAAILLSAPPGWSPVSWRDEEAQMLGDTQTLNYDVKQDETLTVSFPMSASCTLEKDFDIIVSRPELIVNPLSAKIAVGSKVNLSAAGAASYQWAPATGLSSTSISDPVASPVSTIQYSVTGYDSIGCAASAFVSITVESSGFIPSLFTPNSDGSNDDLKVYGVNSVQNFRLRIFNREGNMVYSTRNASEAMHTGWDGTANGTKQPNGVYFWKVEGADGTRELLLNGKREGSFLLIR